MECEKNSKHAQEERDVIEKEVRTKEAIELLDILKFVFWSCGMLFSPSCLTLNRIHKKVAILRWRHYIT